MTDMVQNDVINVTPMAVSKIKGLLEEKNLVGYGLRVFVAGGGCSGYQYGMAFENNIQANDNVIESEGVKIVVDPVSIDYVRGATIDFVDTLMGGGFHIENPNAVSSCGCGSSFRTEEDSAAEASAGGGCGTCSSA